MIAVRMKYLAVILLCKSICQLVQGDRRSECPVLRHTYSTVTFRDRCFQLCNQAEEWVDAKNYCHQGGGRLLMINDAETLEFLQRTLREKRGWGVQQLWIGLNDRTTANDWNWVNFDWDPEINLAFSSWENGYPKGEAWHDLFAKECAYMNRGSGTWYWRNTVCNSRSKQYKFICEYQLPPIPTTVLQSEASATPDVMSSQYTILEHELSTAEKDVASTAVSEDSRSHLDGPFTESTMDKHEYLSNDAPQQKSKVPRYAVILGFVAGVLMVLIFTIIIAVRHRKRVKKSAESTDVYLTTCAVGGLPGPGGACGGDELGVKYSPATAANRGSRLALPNDYETSSRCSTSNLAEATAPKPKQTLELEGGPPALHKVHTVDLGGSIKARRYLNASTEECHMCGTLKRKGPTLVGSMTRGTLPALPTDGGYEIPVSLQPAPLASMTAGSQQTKGVEQVAVSIETEADLNQAYNVPNKEKVETEADMPVYVQDMDDEDQKEETGDIDSGIYSEIPEKGERKTDADDASVYHSIA